MLLHKEVKLRKEMAHHVHDLRHAPHVPFITIGGDQGKMSAEQADPGAILAGPRGNKFNLAGGIYWGT